MMKLTKYLKPFIGSIIAVIILLFIQAVSELSLPDYMSNIVNIDNYKVRQTDGNIYYCGFVSGTGDFGSAQLFR